MRMYFDGYAPRGQTNRPYERSVCDLNPHGRDRAGSSISEYCHSREVATKAWDFRAQRPFTKCASLVTCILMMRIIATGPL